MLVGQTCREPLGATAPRPWLSEVLVAFVADHVSVAHWPCWIVAGLAAMAAVGTAGGGGATGATARFGHSALAWAVASLALPIASFVRHAQ